MARCPICGHDNPKAAARCDKCKAWLTQSAEVPAAAPSSTTTKPNDAPLVDSAYAAELLELVRRGQKIEAIKRLRETTGWGLAEAKDAVEALEAGRQVARFDAPTQRPPPSIGDAELLELVRGGNLIAAIKLHRERTGDGLKDAKDAVEALARAHGVPLAQTVGCKSAALMMISGFVAIVVAVVIAVLTANQIAFFGGPN